MTYNVSFGYNEGMLVEAPTPGKAVDIAIDQWTLDGLDLYEAEVIVRRVYS